MKGRFVIYALLVVVCLFAAYMGGIIDNEDIINLSIAIGITYFLICGVGYLVHFVHGNYPNNYSDTIRINKYNIFYWWVRVLKWADKNFSL